MNRQKNVSTLFGAIKNSTLSFVFLAFLLFNCQPKGNKDDLAKLKEEIQVMFDAVPGDFSLAFKRMDDPSQEILIQEKEVFHAASTMKVPVMIELFKQAAEGNFSLQDSIPIINEFRSIVDNSLFSMDLGVDSQENLYERIGKQATYYELMYEMITMSSNLATNILIEKIGADNINSTMRELGAKDNKVLRGVEDTKAFEAGLSNSTTAFDLMLIMEAISKGEAVDSSASQEMFKILADQYFNELIPVLLPKEVIVAHKTGVIIGVEHDAAIVRLPDGTEYVLVMLSKNLESAEDGRSVIAEVSKMIYDHVIENKKL